MDRMLNLGRSEPSTALRETLCELACRVTYRQVADVTQRITGETINHLLAWRTVRDEGGRLIDETKGSSDDADEFGTATYSTRSVESVRPT